MSSTKNVPPPWVENTIQNPWFFEGDEIVVAVETNSGWDIDRIEAIAGANEMHWVHAETGESYDAWQWEDVSFYIVLHGKGPMDEKQMEASQ